MMRRTAALLLASLSTMALAADDAARYRKGERVHVVATYGWVPALDSEASYGAFLAAAKAGTVKAHEEIKLSFLKTLSVLGPQNDVEVVSAEAMTAKGPSLESLAYPGLVPAIVVKSDAGEAPFWVPAIYFRREDRKPYPVEAKFPVLLPNMDFGVTPQPGMTMYVEEADDGDVPMAEGSDNYRLMAKAIKAGDKVGLQQLADRGVIRRTPSGNQALVLKRWTAPLLTNDLPAAEVRFAEGPMKGRVFWVPETYTAVPSLIVVSHHKAKEALGKRPAKGRKVGR